MATYSSILAWIIPRTEEPGGLPSRGSRRVGHDWSDVAAAAAVLSGIPVTRVTPFAMISQFLEILLFFCCLLFAFQFGQFLLIYLEMHLFYAESTDEPIKRHSSFLWWWFWSLVFPLSLKVSTSLITLPFCSWIFFPIKTFNILISYFKFSDNSNIISASGIIWLWFLWFLSFFWMFFLVFWHTLEFLLKAMYVALDNRN